MPLLKEARAWALTLADLVRQRDEEWSHLLQMERTEYDPQGHAQMRRRIYRRFDRAIVDAKRHLVDAMNATERDGIVFMHPVGSDSEFWDAVERGMRLIDVEAASPRE